MPFISSISSKPAHVQGDGAASVFEVHAGIDGAEGELSSAIVVEDNISRLDEIEITAIPQIGLDDLPSADELTVGLRGHGDTANSLGSRIRL